MKTLLSRRTVLPIKRGQSVIVFCADGKHEGFVHAPQEDGALMNDGAMQALRVDWFLKQKKLVAMCDRALGKKLARAGLLAKKP